MYIHTRELGSGESFWSIFGNDPQDDDDVRHHDGEDDPEYRLQKWILIICIVVIGCCALAFLVVCFSPRARRQRAEKKAEKKAEKEAAALAATNFACGPLGRTIDFNPRTLFFTSYKEGSSNSNLPRGFSTRQDHGMPAAPPTSAPSPDIAAAYNNVTSSGSYPIQARYNRRPGLESSVSHSSNAPGEPLAAATRTGRPVAIHDESELDAPPPEYQFHTPEVLHLLASHRNRQALQQSQLRDTNRDLSRWD